jgi:hypothetical protein
MAAGTLLFPISAQVLVSTNGTLQQDLKNQIAVSQDCALAEDGVQP